MEKQNLILVTTDEVRPDRYSCYGKQSRIQTVNVDQIADEGVLFETAISSSCLTPVAHATLLSGVLPPVTNVRDTYSYMEAPMLSHIMKENGYRTAAFVGISLLGALHGFHAGFDHFDEPTIHTATQRMSYEHTFRISYSERQREKGRNGIVDWAGLEREEEMIMWGGDWLPRLLDWIRQNKNDPFFIFAHYYKTHQGGEKDLIALGEIEEGILPEFSYYDAKVKRLDEYIFGNLFRELKKMGLYDRTTVAILSDHGTNLGEHEVPKVPSLDSIYPQHTTLFDHDLHIAWVMKGGGLPMGRRLSGMVRNIDFVPTLIDLFGLKTSLAFQGTSLLPVIEKGVSEGLVAYCEEIYERRGEGVLQAMRTDEYKFIRKVSKGTEELYYLIEDPGEKENLITRTSAEEKEMVNAWRMVMEEYLVRKIPGPELNEEARKRIEARLRVLGYISDT